MVLSRNLSRSLRAREEESDDEPYSDELEGSSPSVLATGDGGEIESSGSEPDADQDEDVDDAESTNGEDVQAQLSKVSFGALAKAQDSLSKHKDTGRKRKRGSDQTADQEDKLQALRERLRELKKSKAGDANTKKPSRKVEEPESDDDTESSNSDQEDSGKKSKSRSSKHAPAVMTSKKPVSRKREVLASKKRTARDPRFEALSGSLDSNQLKHNYAFLDQYRDSEMAELKASIKKTKNEEDKNILKRKLLSMESQKKAKDSKERHEKVVREHKKQERDAVKQGKTPYFLKKSEVKQRALVDQFSNMKGKQRERLIERRRKKATAKERKNMPDARRTAE
ncbi:rrna processing protein [Diplodia corticola]|uniref:rRNA biogenesis protein RRP36 n=1 Tax=Diplodia corticola TaxID=236234 RepID=A0A1J9QU83_9PEZI|nr:rrna processing protein [Diplodia corticola]OJD31546.1 rrna processing protein [Diplodia corticola]